LNNLRNFDIRFQCPKCPKSCPEKQNPQDFPEFFVFFLFFIFFRQIFYIPIVGAGFGTFGTLILIFLIPFFLLFLFFFSCSYNLEENIIEVVIRCRSVLKIVRYIYIKRNNEYPINNNESICLLFYR